MILASGIEMVWVMKINKTGTYIANMLYSACTKLEDFQCYNTTSTTTVVYYARS